LAEDCEQPAGATLAEVVAVALESDALIARNLPSIALTVGAGVTAMPIILGRVSGHLPLTKH
jgi:hypothetical protein